MKFSLKPLLIIITLICVWFGGYSAGRHDYNDELERLTGQNTLMYNSALLRMAENHSLWDEIWYNKLAGKEFNERLNMRFKQYQIQYKKYRRQ